MEIVYRDTVGPTILRVTVTGQDLAAATTLEIHYRKPDGETGEWTGSLYGTDTIQYSIVAADLDQVGTYRVHAYVVLPTYEGQGKPISFQVKDKFQM